MYIDPLESVNLHSHSSSFYIAFVTCPPIMCMQYTCMQHHAFHHVQLRPCTTFESSYKTPDLGIRQTPNGSFQKSSIRSLPCRGVWVTQFCATALARQPFLARRCLIPFFLLVCLFFFSFSELRQLHVGKKKMLLIEPFKTLFFLV